MVAHLYYQGVSRSHPFHSESLLLLALGPNSQKLEGLVSMDLSGHLSQSYSEVKFFLFLWPFHFIGSDGGEELSSLSLKL